MRINELAKEIGKTNKELIEFVRKNGEEVSSHANKITEEMVAKVKAAFATNVDTSKSEEKKEEVQKKKVTAVFRPQNAKQKSSTSSDEKKAGKYINVSKKETNSIDKDEEKAIDKTETLPKK